MSDNSSAAPAIVVNRTYDLALWILLKAEKFPRSFRFTVGDRICARGLDLVEVLTSAAYASNKAPLLDEANRRLNSLRIFLRMAFDLKLMGSDAQQYAAAQLEEIGRMIGGCRKHSVSR